MTTERKTLLAGTLLGGVLLLGTAGLVLAQDPTSTDVPSSLAATRSTMDGQGTSDGQTMMGGMDGDQMSGMPAMHEAMAQGGTCDAELMQPMDEQHDSAP